VAVPLSTGLGTRLVACSLAPTYTTLKFIVNRLFSESDFNVSQGSVATHASCGGIIITILLRIYGTEESFSEKKFVNRLRFDRITVTSLGGLVFFGEPCRLGGTMCTALA